MAAIGPGDPGQREAASPAESPGSEGGQGLLPAEIGTLPGEATPLDAAATASEGPRSPVRALAGSLMGAFRRPRPDAPSPEAADEADGIEDAAAPARSPARRLAGSLLSTIARRRARHRTEAAQTGPDEDQQEGRVPRHTGLEGDAERHRIKSPLHGIADRFQAALRSLSPPRTADGAAEPRADTAGKNVGILTFGMFDQAIPGHVPLV